jgi:hypothetical protein
MTFPCKIKALKYIKHTSGFEMRSGEYATVEVVISNNINRHRGVRVTAEKTNTLYTETALENAIKRGDYALV